MFEIFAPVEVLIREKFPQEKIVSKKKVFDFSLEILKIGEATLAAVFNLPIPYPPTLIETDKKFYLDRRLSDIINYVIWTPLISIVFYWFLTKILFNILNFLPSIQYIQLLLYSIVIIDIVNLVLQIVFMNTKIEIIDKNWLTKTDLGKKTIQLKGVIPNNTFYNFYNKRVGASSYTGSTNISFHRTFLII